MTKGTPANVARYLPEAAQSDPTAPALFVPRGREADGTIRYQVLDRSGLNREADAWARRMTDAGMVRGMRVLLMVRPGLSLTAICFALFKVGAVPVVIDPGMGLRAFLRCVQRSRPEAVVGITAAMVVSRLFPIRFRSVRIRVRVANDRTLAPASGMEPFPLASTRADDLAAVLFTSGSTGPAKGVCYEHGMFEAQVAAIGSAYGIRSGEIDLPMLPIFALFNPALGMATVVPEINPSRPATVDPAKIVQAIQQCGVTNSFGSPVLWRKIADYCIRMGETLPSLRRILMAGAPVPPELMRDFRQIAPNSHTHSPYGATEVLPVSSIMDETVLARTAALTRTGAGTCVGQPLPEVDVRIIRATQGPIESIEQVVDLPTGEVGEIVATGPMVTRTYDRLPEATAGAKIRDGDRIWHRMGDLGRLDPDGTLWFCGRQVEAVRTAGGVFYTDCCEGVFNQHREVRRTALIGWKEKGEIVPAIVIEPGRKRLLNHSLSQERLAADLRELAESIPHTAAIRHFFFHPSFPVDVRHNAKIHRLKLAREFARKKPLVLES
jgi:acyl-CoA synthetase (AMP-forming)/AMP-acid ligase II